MIYYFKEVFRENGFYILLAIFGFTSAFVTLFIDVNTNISIKWLIAIILLSAFIVMIFFKVLVIILEQKQLHNEIKIVKLRKQGKVSVILKTKRSISYNSLLSIYVKKEGIEEFHCLCFVNNVQDNGLLSANIIKCEKELSNNLIKKSIVKTTIPLTILEKIYEKKYTINNTGENI